VIFAWHRFISTSRPRLAVSSLTTYLYGISGLLPLRYLFSASTLKFDNDRTFNAQASQFDSGPTRIRVFRERTSKICDGLFSFSDLLKDESSVEVGHCVMWTQLDRPVGVWQSLCRHARIKISLRSAVVRAATVWVEADRFVKVAYGSAEIVLFQPSSAAIVVGAGIRRIETDRFVKIGDRAIVVVLFYPRAAAIPEGYRVAWVETDRFIVVVDGAVVIVFGVPTETAVTVGLLS
jgi:hypothetical protein